MNKTAEKVEELKGIIDATEIADIKRMNFRLSDAIRMGSQVSKQAVGWGDGDSMCALHAAVAAGTALGYLKD